MTNTDRRFGVYGAAAFKVPVRVATTANITLSGLQTIDGVTVVADDRVLVKDQTDATENGIYVASTGPWVRAKDCNGPHDVVKGTLVLITSGSVGISRIFKLTTADPVEIGTSELTYSPHIIRASAADPIYLDDPTFGAVADGVVNADGSTNYSTATDNSLAIKAFLDACASTKRPGIIPPGGWLYKQGGSVIQVTAASGIRITGSHEDSNLIYVNPLNQSGIVIGSGTNGVNNMDAQASPLSLAADTSTGSLVLTLATSAGGETATQRLARDMQIYLCDTSQPIPYRANPFNAAIPGTIAYYRGSFCKVERVISSTQIEISGVTEWNFTSGTKVGYWNAPNRGVVFENLRFTYDRLNSYQGGAGSALVLAGCLDPKMYNIKSLHASSRAFAWRDCIGVDLDTLIGEATVPGLGSLSTATGTGHSMFRNINTEGGTHGIDFGGGEYDPSLHCTVIGVRARGFSGGVIGSHKAAGHLKFSHIDIVGSSDAWNLDDDSETDEFDKSTAITLRGPYCEVSYATVSRAAIAFRSHKTTNHRWTNCTSIECGRGMYIDDTCEVTARNIEHINPVWWGTHLNMNVGPNQNLALADNQKYDDIRVTGTPPSQGDLLLYTGGQYDLEERFRYGGWSFTRFERNGAPAVMVGQGACATDFPGFLTSPSFERASQLVGPAYSIAPATGAASVTVASTAGVTVGYVGSEILEVPGGTLTATGRATRLRVETMEIGSITLDSGGLLHAPGDVLVLEGGSATTKAEYTVGTVDGSGTILTGTLTNPGVYTSAPTSFGQFSTTGAGANVTVTAVTIRNAGRNHIVGDVIMAVSGSPVRDSSGNPIGPTIEVDSVDANGGITAITLLTGGEFYSLSPALTLDQRTTTGSGVSSSFNITGSTNRKATFHNAVLFPLTASVSYAGKYTVAPTSPVTPTSVSGAGAGATFTVVYGSLADLGESPKEQVSITGSGSSIVGFGPRRGVFRRVQFAGAQTLVAGATLILPNNGNNIVTAANDTLQAWSDFGVPVAWTVSAYTRYGGNALAPVRQATPTAKTNGATLTAAEIRVGIVTVNAADNLADNYQLPTATNMDTGFPEWSAGDAFDFTIIDENANAAADATVTTNTGWTLVGNMVVEANDADRARSSAVFRARKTGAAAWTLYRLT